MFRLYRKVVQQVRPFSSHLERIVAVHMKDRQLTVQWSNNRTTHLPYLYLRDNCQEPESLDPSTKQRLFNPAFAIDKDIRAEQVDYDGQQVCITWPDGHRSRFCSSWLLKNSEGVSIENELSRLPVDRRLWKADHYSSIARFDFDTVMKDDGSLLDLLLNLESSGLVMVEGVGTESQRVMQFCERISYPRPCIYGRDIVKIDARPTPSNLANTNRELPLHTDLPYYDHTPGVQLLHAIRQPDGSGGSSRLCDGFSIASELREKNPTAFYMLTQFPVHYLHFGKDYLDYNLECWRPPISLDKSGEISAICFNNQARGPRYHASLNGRLHEWYEAYYAFSHLTRSPEFLLEFKLEPSQMVVFNNLRVLHGRQRFEGHYRYLESAYLDWDEIWSKARVIMAETGDRL